jgi:hypothetical protein
MAAIDRFQDQYLDAHRAGALNWPYTRAPLVTPNDDVDLEYVTRALFVGGSGNLVVVMKDGNEQTFNNVQAGTELRIRVSRVKATGTTATLIQAME